MILLQYVNDKNSEYVRKHGMRALIQAGIRTAVALVGMGLDAYLGGRGALAFLAMLILIAIWFYNNSEIKNISNAQNRALLEETEEADRFYTNLSSPEGRTAAPPSQIEKSPLSYSSSSSYREALNSIYKNLRSDDDANVLSALNSLSKISYSSEAVRNRLEQLALKSANEEIRQKSLDALNTAANRAVQKHHLSEALGRGFRSTLLQEINKWVEAGLLDSLHATVIRRRYDFDIVSPSAPQTPPAPRPAPTVATPPPTLAPQPSAPAAAEPRPVSPIPATPQPVAVTPQPQPEPKPVVPPAPPQPRPTLLQTLTSEGAIKIYLYLGAFFVIAAAAILGVLVEAFRVPILLLGTLIFGGAAVGIKKRLPQPSFALFIVFSFLMVITANVLEKTIRPSLNLSSDFTNAYWVAGFLFMALVWSGGVWFYESRFFSITAFGALTLSAFRLGNLIDITEVYFLLFSLVAFVGLAGTWLLRKWKDFKFAASLFYAVQVVQFFSLLFSFISFFNHPENNLFYLFSLTTWILGTLFYLASDWTQPSVLFAIAAAGALLPMPWFIKSAFNMEEMGASILLFVWGAFFSVVSEALARFDKVKKYSLPVLLSALPNLLLSVVLGFAHQIWLGMILSFATFLLMTTLHFVRNRWALWAWALIHFIVAYFAFFQLETIKELRIFFGYPLVASAVLFLLPDLFLKKDWSANLRWRLAPRLFGAALLAASSFYLLLPADSGHVAALYFVLALFVAVYALAYRKPYLGYLSALYFAATVFYFFDALDFNLWRPALVSLAVFYYFAGVLIRNKKQWGETLRNSGMILGSFVSLVALVSANSSGGWLAIANIPEAFQTAYIYLALGIWYGALIVFGLLFFIEMRLRRNGIFEIGAPIILSIAAYLILNDFHVKPAAHYLLTFSLIWLLEDLLSHFAFKNERPLRFVIRAVGGVFAALNYVFLIRESNAWIPSAQFSVYALLFLTMCLVYRQPLLLYASTLTLPLAAFFTLRALGVDGWLAERRIYLTTWLPVITALSVGYYALGALLRKEENWSQALRYSGLIVGSLMSVASLFTFKDIGGGWYALIIGLLFIAEMHLSRNGLFEVGAPLLFTLGAFLILRGFKIDEIPYHLLTYSSIWLLDDLLARLAFAHPRPLKLPVRILGAALAAINFTFLFAAADHWIPAIGFGVYALLFLTVCLVYRQPLLLYASTLTLPLAAFFTLRALGVDGWLAERRIYLTTWLPVITVLSVGYYALGAILRKRENWSQALRYSGLIIGSLMSVAALFTFKDIGGGWYALIIGLLFIAEMHLSRNGLFEVGAPLLFTLGAFLILRGFKVDEFPYHLLAYSSIWLLDDLFAHLAFAHPRPLKLPVRILGAALAAFNYVFLFTATDHWIPVIGFAVYALLAAAFCFVYRQPKLLYAFTLSASLFAAFFFRAFGVNQWIYPVIFTAMGYYVIGAGLRAFNRFEGWDKPLLHSGLAFGVIVSASAFFFGGWGAAIPVAIAASFWAFEAYFKRDVRLSFPANLLYLSAYLIILRSMHVTEPQFFSVGAALFGLIQHYLLTRAGSKKGAYIMGMLSQFILLGTTYIEMINKNDVNYFFLLFVQSLVVLIYGIVIRSRSLTFFPIGFVVLGVITVTYSALKGLGSIILIGCTGVLLLLFGIGATLLRERIKKLSEKFSGWEA
ncbi:MAG: hypothetical protein LC099_04440 [Anaerolineales bacterium]|nr:hypothetical protein [Anaerolineales bacterium]